MAKCKICGTKLKELFLGKLKGTIIKKAGSNKPHHVCFDCQKKLKTKEEILKKL
tara:strand:- start:86 stop:247 length:162 start_codon:yes stop_codon:yes gene_type:complete